MRPDVVMLKPCSTGLLCRLQQTRPAALRRECGGMPVCSTHQVVNESNDLARGVLHEVNERRADSADKLLQLLQAHPEELWGESLRRQHSTARQKASCSYSCLGEWTALPLVLLGVIWAAMTAIECCRCAQWARHRALSM